MASKYIKTPLEVIKRYLLFDWLYYFTPFVLCIFYGIFAFEFTSLQMLVNSFFSNVFNFGAAIGLFITVPNVATLVRCQKKVLRDMPDDIILKAASTERFGGAGCGKTSSAVLQAIFEAHEMENKLTLLYYYIKSNYERWIVENPRKVKDFHELEKSILFWRENPQYIPFLGSNVKLYDTNGRESYYVDGNALEQKVWIPTMYILIDEAGNEVPQELYKERPAGVTMFFRYIRHFGFRISLLEQKVDGVYINVRSVLGGRCLAMGQSNKLLPYTLIDILNFLKNRLKRYDTDDYTDLSEEKANAMRKHFHGLGHFIEKLESFSSKLGFRIWDEMISYCPEAESEIPPERIQIYCTNEMPVSYDDREFSQLYLQNKENPVEGDFVTKSTDAGQRILRYFNEQEKQAKKDLLTKQKDDLKLQNDLEREKQRSLKLAKSREKLEKEKVKAKDS